MITGSSVVLMIEDMITVVIMITGFQLPCVIEDMITRTQLS